MQFTDDEMWKATVDCDTSYGGKFFYAVKTVGVYCRPSCKSRTPLRKNVCYFETPQEAEKAGFRPCKRCRPDLSDYAPVLEIVRHTKELIDGYYHNREGLTEKMKQLGISSGHLTAIFKQQYGMTPIQYLRQLQTEYAKKMLVETDMPIIDIAFDIGFDSLSAFYTFFRKHTGTTPKEYRINKMVQK
ncbi:bifunctional transcriptional activator/DNA repair enzyme AdaA [Leadbettera azotonutricia]|uniref:Methylphosphotriester-DNA alkyltransferase n=1 Tax=Leadbettera azotonutricia (strain ATCC BAA-888 / DSM 13862 / ZAS-9) TaxID=545695 RepID=F5Y7T6_LEAAZ|nr:Ada metal-binding domain-containing protein [Leadbettera azotonutricia]AEF82675.1 methylphosphotriester-DNA alkyltransferase [Leadbettera azotonutricia ZAS-9]